MAHVIRVQTCAESLLVAGTCCADGCSATATHAVLVHETLVEHARCVDHLAMPGERVAVKPLHWNPLWSPP